jgi:FAD/FMN-containing dehydrogenase
MAYLPRHREGGRGPGQAVAQITRRGLTPAVLELLDRFCRALDPLEIFNPGKG